MVTRLLKTSLFFSLVLLFWVECSEDKKSKISESNDKEYSVAGKTETQLYEVEMNYDSLMVVFEELTKQVEATPDDLDLRHKLVTTCLDEQHNRILAFGEGIPPTNARTPTLALNYAAKAAQIDAYRWAVRVKKWNLDIANNDSIIANADLPGARLLSKLVLPDSTVKVLIELKPVELP